MHSRAVTIVLTLIFLLTIRGAALGQSATLSAVGEGAVGNQNPKSAPGSSQSNDPNSPAQTCAKFDPKQLENDAAIANDAEGLAWSIVYNYSTLQANVTQADAAIPSTRVKGRLPQFNLVVLSAALSMKECKTATVQTATKQTNKQVGAPSSSDGSTSAVQKVGIPQLLGVAVENGAVTSNVSGTTITLSTTPYGFIYAFARDQDTEQAYEDSPFFTHLGLSASFNVGSNSSDPLASATRKQVSQWQAKYALRDTSIRSSAVRGFYTSELAQAAANLAKDLSDPANGAADPLLVDVSGILLSNWNSLFPNVKQAYTEVANQPNATDPGPTTKILAMQILQILDKDPGYQSALSVAGQNSLLGNLASRYSKDAATFATQEKKFETSVSNLAKGWNGALSFNQKFPTTTTSAATSSASSSTAKPPVPPYLVGELDVTCEPKTDNTQKVACPLGPKATLTGNFSGSFYANPNPALNETAFRGGNGALQAQWSLGPGFVKVKSANDKSQMTLSASGSYQRLQENKDQKGKRPDIVLGNLKLEIPISSGVSFPLSFSVANATEQIKETYVKGNFGVSFDLDKLASLLKANQ